MQKDAYNFLSYYFVFTVKTTALQYSYFYCLVRLWNSLPRHIRKASSVVLFKKHDNDLYNLQFR